MIGLDLGRRVHKKQVKMRNKINSILLLLVFSIYTYIYLMFRILSYFFLTPSEDILYKRNDKEDTLHVSIQNHYLISGCGEKLFPQKYEP